MQAIGQRIIDGVNSRVVEQSLVSGMDDGDVMRLGITPGSLLVSGGDGGDDDVWMSFGGNDEGDGSAMALL